MIDSIHQSMLNMACRCGEQFRRRYLEGERIPPGAAAARGTGLHAANETNLRQKIVTRTDLPLADLQDAARDGFVHALSDGVFMAKDEVAAKDRILNDALNDCISMTGLYRAVIAPQIDPVAVEKEFRFTVPWITLPLAGKIDIQREGRVDDLKTSGKKWADGQIHQEIQPVFYSLAHEHETGERPLFTYHIIRNLKAGPELQVQSMTATDAHYRALRYRLETMEKMIRTGLFPPANPNSWWCSERWCGYASSCCYYLKY